MIGARVNGQLATINYKIQNGDRIEIITSQNSRGPSRDWLNIVKSNQAKTKINQWFKNELKEDNIQKGKEMLLAFCRANNVDPAQIMIPQYMNTILQKYGFRDWDAVQAAVGHGGLREGQIINRMRDLYEKDHPHIISDEELIEDINEAAAHRKLTVKRSGGVAVQGTDDLAVRFSKCCSPIPGDEIVGYVTRGRGVSIHRTDCVNIMVLPEDERARLIEAEWERSEQDTPGNEKYETGIRIFTSDRQGLLFDVTRLLNDKGVSILNMNVRTSKQGTATIELAFSTTGKDELREVVEKLRTINGVMDIERTSG
jgi:GTP pyrophosphokinase